MRYTLLVVTALVVFCSTLHAQDNLPLPSLSPNTKQYLFTVSEMGGKTAPMRDYVYKKTAAGTYISAMVKVNTGFDASKFTALGVNVGTKAGSIWTVQVPLDKVEAFTKIRGVSYIELDVPTFFNMDSVRKLTHVDSVQQGINLPMPYAGKDVVLGIVDVGFDFTHPAFRDTSGHIYRIKRAWMQKTPGNAPSGYLYGTELTDSASIWDAHTDNNKNSHGSHVAGMAGGSGIGGATYTLSTTTLNNKKYRGIAYETDLVMVGILPDSIQWQNTGVSDIVDGINYIFQYATSVGKPAIVNLSWGTVVGPHDGTSLFSQAVDNLTGPGKIFACSAGNEGDAAIHLGKSFSTVDTVVSTFVNLDTAVKATWLDIWGDAGKTFCVKADLYNNTQTAAGSYACLDNNVHRQYLIGSNGDTCTVTFTSTISAFNSKPRMYVSITSKVQDTVVLSIKSTDGKVDLWTGYIFEGHGYFGTLTKNGRSWAVGGDSAITVSDLVATRSAISVGAFVSNVGFRSLTSGPLAAPDAVYGDLATFSSHGPTADNRIKPDITAPGEFVVSSVSSYDSSLIPGGSDYISVVCKALDTLTNRTYYYAGFAGTSMSCPATSGIIALMLQVNPQLNPEDVRNILALTAMQDNYTSALPTTGDNRWGHGKINAYQAVVMASTYRTGINNVVNNLNCTVYPNPSATGNFTLKYTADKEAVATVQVFALDGKMVAAENWSITAGNNSKVVDLTHLNNAVYIIKVATATGQTVLPVMVAK